MCGASRTSWLCSPAVSASTWTVKNWSRNTTREYLHHARQRHFLAGAWRATRRALVAGYGSLIEQWVS